MWLKEFFSDKINNMIEFFINQYNKEGVKTIAKYRGLILSCICAIAPVYTYLYLYSATFLEIDNPSIILLTIFIFSTILFTVIYISSLVFSTKFLDYKINNKLLNINKDEAPNYLIKLNTALTSIIMLFLSIIIILLYYFNNKSLFPFEQIISIGFILIYITISFICNLYFFKKN